MVCLVFRLESGMFLVSLLHLSRADIGGAKVRAGVVVEAVGKDRVGKLLAGGSWRPNRVKTGVWLMELVLGTG